MTIENYALSMRDCRSSTAVAKPWPSAISSRISDSGVGREDFDLADDAAEIEGQFGVELARQLLHAPVLGKAGHMQQPESAVAGGEQGVAKQRRADAVTLPRLLHADGGLRLVRKTQAQRPQLGGPANHSIDEKAVHDGVERNGQIGVIANEVVGYAAAEPVVTALRVETQYMVAVFGGLSDPQFADHAAFGKNVLHSTGLLTLSSKRPT